jgi:hypothetical protein
MALTQQTGMVVGMCKSYTNEAEELLNSDCSWFKIMESGATNQGNPLDWAYVGE